MSTNDFLPFGIGAGANVLSQSDYAALVARLSGFQSGVANSAQVNKAIRQAAFVAAMIGQFTADYGGDALDNGDLPTFEENFKNALAAWIASGESPVDLSGYVLRAGDTMTGAFVAPAGFRTAARLLSTATTLAAADLGKFIEITASSTITTTLPNPIGVGGSRIVVWNNTAYAQTLSTPAGAFIGPNVTSGTTIPMLPGDIFNLESDAYNWIRTSAASQASTTFPVASFYTTSATWTKTAGAKKAWILGHAAGGAGGGTSGTGGSAAGTGGGAGEFRVGLFDISGVASATVGIGAGGSGGTNIDGGNGGDTTVGALMTCKGGNGGGRNLVINANFSLGGTGGSGGWGFPGCGGGGAQGGTGGVGGSGAIGGGGRGGDSTQGNQDGGAGRRGGGGGGADGFIGSAAAGGKGGDGWVIIVEM